MRLYTLVLLALLINTGCSNSETSTPIVLDNKQDAPQYSAEALNLAQDKDRLAAAVLQQNVKVEHGFFDSEIPELGSPEANSLLERYAVDSPELLPKLALLAGAMDDPDYNLYICAADILSKYAEDEISAATGPTGRAKQGFGNLPSTKRRKQMEAWGTLENVANALDAARPGLSETLKDLYRSEKSRPAIALWYSERDRLCLVD